MAYGMKGQLGISAQQSFGTATTSFEYIPIVSEAITTEVEQIMEEGMRQRFAEGPIQEGLETTAGDVVLDGHPVLIGHFLKAVLGTATTTTTGAASGSYHEHEFLPITTDFDDGFTALPPYTMEIYRDGGSAWQFTDTIFNSLAIDITAGEIGRVTAGTMCRTTSLQNKTSASYLATSGMEPFTWNTASISVGSTAGSSAIWESLSINIDNQVEGIPFLDNTKRVGRFKRSTWRQVRFSGTISFEDTVEWTKFKTNSQQRLLVTLDDTNVTSLNILTLDIPQARYETFPINQGGPGRITADIAGRAVYDTDSSYEIRVTLINSRNIGY
jgi:hypothetical protein